MTTRFSYTICVIFSFLVLSWFKVKLLLKTKNCRNQISYSIGILPIHLKSHTREKLDFSKKNFLWCLGGFYPFSQEQSDTYFYEIKKILENLLPCMIFPGGKSPNLLFHLLGKYRFVCGPFFNLEC